MFLQQNRQRIEKEYIIRKEEIPRVFSKIDDKIAACTQEVALAVKYLYAFMPCSDIGNYPFEYFFDYACHGYRLYEEYSEVRSLPEDIFLNYVLFHRVNEEEIRPCRSLFYESLKDRIKDLDKKEALLEVNHWCAKEVTYQSTDARTLSALGVYQRGIGRCGEESTFMVNALRSVGIPSRQVYAPYWAHCDDNHAWVEMWCDGTWYFTGACEPQPILNQGWFLNASSRAMMIHSRKFDSAQDEINLIGKKQTVTVLNELDRYAVVKRITVEVRDEAHRPVSDAQVFFEVVNYAQFVPIAETEQTMRERHNFLPDWEVCASMSYPENTRNVWERHTLMCEEKNTVQWLYPIKKEAQVLKIVQRIYGCPMICPLRVTCQFTRRSQASSGSEKTISA